jgi:aminocarboxymuconate-semialdehyde decarboxylase
VTEPSHSATPIVDVHAHHFPRALAERGLTPQGPRWPHLETGAEGSGRILVGDSVFRQVTSDLWDVAERVELLDRTGIATQVLSPVPVMLTYWADGPSAAAYARAVNTALAEDVARAPGRLVGLGTVPLQAPELAVEELRHAVTTLGLRGVEIGSSVEGADLDAAALRPFWETAEELDALVLVHPMDGGGGVVRRAGQPYDFGAGMLTDTALAAGSLVFGGVLEEFPRLTVVLVHGCGAFAWLYPRMRLADQVWGKGDPAAADARVRSLWVDTLVFDPEHLRLLVHRFGPDKVVVGTDHPFFPAVTSDIGRFVTEAAHLGAIGPGEVDAVLSGNARRLLAGGESPTSDDGAMTSIGRSE